jgi:uncharacterized MnhB-related membrane protein
MRRKAIVGGPILSERLLHAWPRALATAVLGAEICDSLLAAAVRRRKRFSRETAMAD